MSTSRTVSYKCPYCVRVFNTQVWDTVNADSDPDLRDRCLSGDLFKVLCPHCQKDFMIQYPLVYIDEAHRFILWLSEKEVPSSLLFSARAIYRRYGREQVPFLIPWDRDETTGIYDFVISPENAAGMSEEADRLLQEHAVSGRVRMLAGLFIEEMLLLIQEKNSGKGPLDAECTIMAEPAGVRVILRDSGRILDVTDTDAMTDSFRQYVVANLMVVQDCKAYMTTTGYNRIELFFADGAAEAQDRPETVD